jgi:deoxyribodipyrimidine photo-lyase
MKIAIIWAGIAGLACEGMLRNSGIMPVLFDKARGPVLPRFIVEPTLWQQPDMAMRHLAFVAESIVEVQAALAALGLTLVIFIGDAVSVLGYIQARLGIDAL